MHTPLTIGVVGLGRLGALYARHFATRLPGSRLHAVFDVRAEVAAEIARETGAPRPCRSLEEMLADTELDAIVVTTPTKLHAGTVIAAARAGKAIFCEKPLSLDLDEAQAMQRTVDEAKVFFQLGFMRRFAPRLLRGQEEDRGRGDRPADRVQVVVA